MSEPCLKREAKPLPWDDLMAVGLGRLGLAPNVFWNMTLPELDAALRGAFGDRLAGALDRSELKDLMIRFPDEQRGS